MKKILNWVFGSFFRTLGRVLVYLFIGYVFFTLIDFGNFNFTDLLGFEYVNASTYDMPSWSFLYYDQAMTQQVPTNGNYAVINTPFSTLNGDNTIKDLYFPQINTTELKGGSIDFQLFFEFPFVANQSSSEIHANDYCTRWEWASIDSNNNVIKWKCAQVSSGQTSTITDKEYLTPYSYLIATLWNKSGTAYSVCDLQNQRLSCPISRFMDDVDHITLQYKAYLTSTYTGNYNLSIFLDKSLYKSDGTIISNSINNQTQQQHQDSQNTQNAINGVNDSITNSNTSEANDNASGFFDNFTDNDHGLSSIITAPLRAINSMLNDTCVAPGATYKGQSFSLPCGSMLWNRPGGSDFRNFINVFYGGFLAYFVIRSLFFDVEKLKNPNNDKVEVEKL